MKANSNDHHMDSIRVTLFVKFLSHKTSKPPLFRYRQSKIGIGNISKIQFDVKLRNSKFKFHSQSYWRIKCLSYLRFPQIRYNPVNVKRKKQKENRNQGHCSFNHKHDWCGFDVLPEANKRNFSGLIGSISKIICDAKSMV